MKKDTNKISRKGAIIIDIKGMDLLGISKKLQPYINDYFVCCELTDIDDGMFAESYMFEFEEVKHLIPAKYHSSFNQTDKFNGASGFLNFSYQARRFRGREYTVMLVSNEDYSKALFLYVQENNLTTDAQNDILVTDLMNED